MTDQDAQSIVAFRYGLPQATTDDGKPASPWSLRELSRLLFTRFRRVRGDFDDDVAADF